MKPEIPYHPFAPGFPPASFYRSWGWGSIQHIKDIEDYRAFAYISLYGVDDPREKLRIKIDLLFDIFGSRILEEMGTDFRIHRDMVRTPY